MMMNSLTEREHRLRNRTKRVVNRDYLPATLGDANGLIPDTSLVGHVLVRVQAGLGLTPQVISVRGPVGRLIKLDPGTPIELEWDKKNRLYVAAIDPDALIAMQVDPVAYSQQALSPRVTQNNLETLWVFQSSPPSTVVNVKAWNPISDGTYYLFPGGSIDLGVGDWDLIPAAGYQAWVAVFVEDDFLTLAATSSSVVPLNDFFDQQEAIQECLDARPSGSTPVWALLLGDGQTEISQGQIEPGPTSTDLRNIINTPDGISGVSFRKILTSANGLVLVDANGYVMTRAV
jgi:hypothetical protein